jgi:acyl-CoA dehydrogenase
MIVDEIATLCADFEAEYWREMDRQGAFPTEFVAAIADQGWMGAIIPEEYGGAGLGTVEAAMILEEITASGAGFGGSMSVHGSMFITPLLIEYASEEIKRSVLPEIAHGESLLECFALTEPESGFDSTAMSTTAERVGDHYLVNGQKVWISALHGSDYMVLVARTSSLEEIDRKTDGISLFLVDIDDGLEQGTIETAEIEKNIRSVPPSYEVWFEDLEVPASNLIGTEGDGFYHVLDGLNQERVLIAAECVGLARVALETAVEYAKEREVFGRPIGKNQAIQHPLAEAHLRTNSARTTTYDAARALERGDDDGEAANSATYMSREAATMATDVAVQTHGGWGVAVEYDVERWWRESRLARLGPVSDEMVLNHIGEHVLDLPRSY